MRNENQIRQQGLDLQNIERAFIWQNLTADFQRELITAEPIIRTKIDHHIIAALQGFASYPSMFYQNAFIYLQLNLAEQKELKYYSEKVGQMYLNQLQQENESRHTYSLVDGTGRILDSVVY